MLTFKAVRSFFLTVDLNNAINVYFVFTGFIVINGHLCSKETASLQRMLNRLFDVKIFKGLLVVF